VDFAAFLNSPAGIAVKAALAAAFLDFATGSFAALRDGTFTLDALAAFVRKHVLGRVAPITAVLAAGYASGDQVLIAAAIAMLTAYAAETVSSVLGNLNPPKEGDVKTGTASNPIPED
jgi:hypothetical protein